MADDDFAQIPPICSIVKGDQKILSLEKKKKKAKSGLGNNMFINL